MLRTAALACAVLLVPLAGCLSDPLGGSLEATLEVDRSSLAPGERVNVSVSFHNGGSTDYTYDHPGCPPTDVRVWVGTDEGRIRLYRYGREPVAGACQVREATIGAGETVEATVHWNARMQPSPPAPHEGDRVPAGEYTITAELARADEGPGFTQQATVEVTG